MIQNMGKGDEVRVLGVVEVPSLIWQNISGVVTSIAHKQNDDTLVTVVTKGFGRRFLRGELFTIWRPINDLH